MTDSIQIVPFTCDGVREVIEEEVDYFAYVRRVCSSHFPYLVVEELVTEVVEIAQREGATKIREGLQAHIDELEDRITEILHLQDKRMKLIPKNEAQEELPLALKRIVEQKAALQAFHLAREEHRTFRMSLKDPIILDYLCKEDYATIMELQKNIHDALAWYGEIMLSIQGVV